MRLARKRGRFYQAGYAARALIMTLSIRRWSLCLMACDLLAIIIVNIAYFHTVLKPIFSQFFRDALKIVLI